MAVEFHKLTIRIPADLKQWLDVRSKLNASSMGSEIVRALREVVEREANSREQS
jgi:hypothetical protein